MTDVKKRNSLKMLGVGGLLATSGSVVNAAVRGSDVKPNGQLPELEILIVDSNDFEFSTVVITNLTSTEIRLSEFIHGTISYDDKIVDLNTTPFVQKLNTNDLVLAAKHSASAFVIPANSADVESIDMFSAQSSVSDVGASTRVAKLGATLSGGKAIVHPTHNGAISMVSQS